MQQEGGGESMTMDYKDDEDKATTVTVVMDGVTATQWQYRQGTVQ